MGKLLVAFCLVASLSYAAQAPLPLEIQVHKSDRILRGRVTHIESHPGTNEFGDQLIYSEISLHTEEALKGERSDLLVRVEGGTYNGITLDVNEAPKFREGEEVLLFVKSTPLLNLAYGGSKAKYTIVNGYLRGGVAYSDAKSRIISIIKSKQKIK